MKDLIDSGLSYGELLALLRKDLALDATTDILQATLLQALMPGTLLTYLRDTAGKSPFLQLPSTKQQIIDVGTATITFPGASPSSNEPTVNHSLSPRTPVIVLAGYTTGLPDSIPGTLVCRGYTSTTFTVFAKHTANISAGSIGVGWIAIG